MDCADTTMCISSQSCLSCLAMLATAVGDSGTQVFYHQYKSLVSPILPSSMSSTLIGTTEEK